MNEENEVIIEPKAEDEVVQGSEPGPTAFPDNLPIDVLPSQGYSYDDDDDDSSD